MNNLSRLPARLFIFYFQDVQAYIQLRDYSVLHLSLDIVSRLFLVDKAEDSVGNQTLNSGLSQVTSFSEGQSSITTPAQDRRANNK